MSSDVRRSVLAWVLATAIVGIWSYFILFGSQVPSFDKPLAPVTFFVFGWLMRGGAAAKASGKECRRDITLRLTTAEGLKH